MHPALRMLLCVAVALSHKYDFTYNKPWDPFRRSITECEMCHQGTCVMMNEGRCEYYAEADKVLDDDNDDEEEGSIKVDEQNSDGKVDAMLFELVNSASTARKSCIPLISQYTDCTQENICTGCKFWTCNEEGRWMRGEKQKCRPAAKLKIDHRVVGIVVDTLKRKEITQNREKRSATYVNTAQNNKDKLSYADISKWLYGVEPLNNGDKYVDVENILKYFQVNDTGYPEVYEKSYSSNNESVLFSNPNSFTNKSENYIDLLEFNDILNSWVTEELSTQNPLKITIPSRTLTHHYSDELQLKDLDDYDPVRLIKRDTSKLLKNGSLADLKMNSTNNNFTFEQVLTDAIQGLSKITTEKQIELEELLNIQDNLVKLAKAHNITHHLNITVARDNYNKHHIAIYKVDMFTKCVELLKREIYRTIKDVIQTAILSNSSDLQKNLKVLFSKITKYIFCENYKFDTKGNVSNNQDCSSNHIYKYNTGEDREYRKFNPVIDLSYILAQINKTYMNPMQILNVDVRKIIKRIIKQLYLDDFTVIDLIVHETYNHMNDYLENVGTNWNKMLQDISESNASDKLHRIKLLHLTLQADIGKLEDTVTLIEFARNRRMTIVNGNTVDESILRIRNNLAIINSNVKRLARRQEKNNKYRQEQNKSIKKPSIIQKLSKFFKKSRDNIKNMLKKKFSKSEIIKKITKKKVDESERQRMLKYQETMKQWRDNLNIVPGRGKRSAGGFQYLAERLKSIIPSYLRKKVNPAIQRKNGNKTRSTKTQGGSKNTQRKHTKTKTTLSHQV